MQAKRAAFQFKSAGTSHVGMRRSENQDSYLVLPEMGLFVVADGMGGHQGGQTASTLAIKTIEDYFRNAYATAAVSKTPGAELVESAILAANSAIQARGRVEAELQGMGTTVSALYFAENRLYIGHVGDSRAYLVHPGRIWQLTRDHSLVQEKLRAGIIDRSQLKTDRMKNVITRSVGFDADLSVDVYEVEPNPDDVYILCSDGLYGMIEDSEILAVTDELVFRRNDPKKASEKLIEAANESGGDDNVTAVVVHLSGQGA